MTGKAFGPSTPHWPRARLRHRTDSRPYTPRGGCLSGGSEHGPSCDCGRRRAAGGHGRLHDPASQRPCHSRDHHRDWRGRINFSNGANPWGWDHVENDGPGLRPCADRLACSGREKGHSVAASTSSMISSALSGSMSWVKMKLSSTGPILRRRASSKSGRFSRKRRSGWPSFMRRRGSR